MHFKKSVALCHRERKALPQRACRYYSTQGREYFLTQHIYGFACMHVGSLFGLGCVVSFERIERHWTSFFLPITAQDSPGSSPVYRQPFWAGVCGAENRKELAKNKLSPYLSYPRIPQAPHQDLVLGVKTLLSFPHIFSAAIILLISLCH